MRRALGWMCYRIVMAWPGTWPSGAAAGWILAWAGNYANEQPNGEVRGASPQGEASSREAATSTVVLERKEAE